MHFMHLVSWKTNNARIYLTQILAQLVHGVKCRRRTEPPQPKLRHCVLDKDFSHPRNIFKSDLDP